MKWREVGSKISFSDILVWKWFFLNKSYFQNTFDTFIESTIVFWLDELHYFVWLRNLFNMTSLFFSLNFCQTPLQLANSTQLQLVGVGVDFDFPQKKKGRNPHLDYSRRNDPKCLWRVFGNCLKGVWHVSEGCLACVWRVSGGCLKGVWKVPGGCLWDDWMVIW